MATLFQLPKTSPVFGGSSLPGAKLYFFQSGTTTPIVTYTTADLDVEQDHPVEANADGVFDPIFIDEATFENYRVQLKTSTDVLKYDIDEVPTFVDFASAFSTQFSTRHISAVKTINTSRVSTTVQAADPELFVSLAANTKYRINIQFKWDCTTTETQGIRIGFAVPVGSTFTGSASYSTAPTTTASVYVNEGTSFDVDPVTAGVSQFMNIAGICEIGSTAGAFTLLWGQNNSSANNTTIYAVGSAIVAEKL